MRLQPQGSAARARAQVAGRGRVPRGRARRRQRQAPLGPPVRRQRSPRRLAAQLSESALWQPTEADHARTQSARPLRLREVQTRAHRARQHRLAGLQQVPRHRRAHFAQSTTRSAAQHIPAEDARQRQCARALRLSHARQVRRQVAGRSCARDVAQLASGSIRTRFHSSDDGFILTLFVCLLVYEQGFVPTQRREWLQRRRDGHAEQERVDSRLSAQGGALHCVSTRAQSFGQDSHCHGR